MHRSHRCVSRCSRLFCGCCLWARHAFDLFRNTSASFIFSIECCWWQVDFLGIKRKSQVATYRIMHLPLRLGVELTVSSSAAAETGLLTLASASTVVVAVSCAATNPIRHTSSSSSGASHSRRHGRSRRAVLGIVCVRVVSVSHTRVEWAIRCACHPFTFGCLSICVCRMLYFRIFVWH